MDSIKGRAADFHRGMGGAEGHKQVRPLLGFGLAAC